MKSENHFGSTVDDLAGLVMADPVLTMRMPKPVNSVFWELGRQVTTVKETVKKVYLIYSSQSGFRICY
ncbi:MAG: HDOD domain-containing protein [bacterium]